MTYDRAIWLLCQMYLPCFSEEEKEALTLAIYTLEKERDNNAKSINNNSSS